MREREPNCGKTVAIELVNQILLCVRYGDDIQSFSFVFEYRSCILKAIRFAESGNAAARQLGGPTIARPDPQIAAAVFGKGLHIRGTEAVRLPVNAKAEIAAVSCRNETDQSVTAPGPQTAVGSLKQIVDHRGGQPVSG